VAKTTANLCTECGVSFREVRPKQTYFLGGREVSRFGIASRVELHCARCGAELRVVPEALGFLGMVLSVLVLSAGQFLPEWGLLSPHAGQLLRLVGLLGMAVVSVFLALRRPRYTTAGVGLPRPWYQQILRVLAILVLLALIAGLLELFGVLPI
jgi:hypothetical protein